MKRKYNFFLVVCLVFICYNSRANIYYVTNTNDAGSNSLRNAITSANSNIGKDSIYFAIAGSGPFTIQLASSLPAINNALLIDGLSQQGSSIFNDLIEIEGNANIVYGLRLLSDSITIRGLKFSNFLNQSGAVLAFDDNFGTTASDYSSTNIQYNYFYNNSIGITVESVYSSSIIFSNIVMSDNLFENSSIGIYLSFSSLNNYYFSNLKIERNKFTDNSGDYNAIYFESFENFQGANIQINANKINNNGGIFFNILSGQAIIDTLIINDNNISNGSNAGNGIYFLIAGSNPITTLNNLLICSDTLINNSSGIVINQEVNNFSKITNAKLENNVITNNLFGGIEYLISGSQGLFEAYNFSIKNNIISNNANGDGLAITLMNGCDGNARASNFHIEGNTIADNYGNGICLVAHKANGYSGIFSNILLNNNIIKNNTKFGLKLVDYQFNIDGNIYTQNSIFNNDSVGIREQLYPIAAFPLPILMSAIYSGSISTITGIINGLPNRSYRIEYFTNTTLDLSGYGEGETFIGDDTITTNSSGYANYNFNTSIDVTNLGVTSTSTDLTTFNTSEFSNMIGLGAGLNENLFNENSITLSPNPFSLSTRISFSQTYGDIALEVYNIQGQLVANDHYKDCSGIVFQRKGLSEGMYFLKLSLDGKRVETKKMVIAD